MDDYAVKEVQREHKGRKYTFPIGVHARNVETDDNHLFITKSEKEGNNAVTFTEEEKRSNIVKGETLSKMMGKVHKIFGDLIKTGTGFRSVTDAVDQGKEEDVVSRKALSSVDNKFGGMSLKKEGEDIYVVYKKGADTVQKKLGSGLEGLKKIVLQVVEVSDSVQPEMTKITCEKNGNVICHTINVNGTGNAVYPYVAEEIDYTDADGNGYKRKWTVDYKYNIKSFFPEEYRNWTSENFYFCINRSKVDCHHAPDNNVGPPRELKRSLVYNQATGILIVKDVAAGTNEDWGDADPNGTRGGHVLYNVSDCELLIIS